MTHWTNTFRPLTAEQYDSASVACQDAYNLMTGSIDQIHVSGSGTYDDIEKAPIHKRYTQMSRMNDFSQLWVADGN